MNDDRLTQLLRDADPYDSGDLGGADLALLDEIVAAPAVDQLARRRRSLRRSLVSGVAVAATITAVVGTVSLLSSPEGTRSPGATPPPTDPGPSVVTPIKYAAAAVRVAEQNPRILVTAPGWKVRTVEGFSPASGEMTFQLGPDKWREVTTYGEADSGSLMGRSRVNDAPRFEVTWYPRDQYESYRADRARESGLQHLSVLGKRSQMISYSTTEHAVMLPPEGEVFIELRGSVGNEAEFKRFLAEDIEQVDVGAWLAAMPESVVTSGSADKAATAVLAGIPLPPGFDRGSLARGVALDPYQFGAKMTGAVACGWIAEWDRARRAGDDAAAQRAADALGTSRQWKVLNEMNAEGDYPEAIWGYADQVQAGTYPEGYRSGLGC